MPFDFKSPAENIVELVTYLIDQGTDGYYYRGQTKHYETCVPSRLRPAVIGKDAEGWVELDGEYADIATPRQRAQGDLSIAAMGMFGRACGNVLSQQYGFSSDAIDITYDPVVAAFFATTKYPSYCHFEAEGELGILYRIPVKGDPVSVETIERSLGSLSLVGEDKFSVFFPEVHDLKALLLRRAITPEAAMEFVHEKLGSKIAAISALKTARYLTTDHLLECVKAGFEKTNLTDAEAIFQHSRIHRQKAGIYFPPYLHEKVHVRTPIELDFLTETEANARHGVAITHGAAKVFCLNSNPFVEKYFFRHSPSHKIDLDGLEQLWPSRDNDPMMQILCHLAENHACKGYLSDFDVAVDDFDAGIIDRGYRPEP